MMLFAKLSKIKHINLKPTHTFFWQMKNRKKHQKKQKKKDLDKINW